MKRYIDEQIEDAIWQSEYIQERIKEREQELKKSDEHILYLNSIKEKQKDSVYSDIKFGGHTYRDEVEYVYTGQIEIIIEKLGEEFSASEMQEYFKSIGIKNYYRATDRTLKQMKHRNTAKYDKSKRMWIKT